MSKPLTFKTESLRVLSSSDLGGVQGGLSGDLGDAGGVRLGDPIKAKRQGTLDPVGETGGTII